MVHSAGTCRFYCHGNGNEGCVKFFRRVAMQVWRFGAHSPLLEEAGMKNAPMKSTAETWPEASWFPDTNT